jgi:hypothetical protein
MTLGWARTRLHREVRSQLPRVLRPIPPYRLLGRLFFRGPDHHIALTLHESFHAFQGALAPARFAAAEEATRFEGAYPWDDSASTDAWGQELSALADALDADAPEDRERLIRQFLDLRRTRRASLAPDLHEYERHREWLEGLAKYVEMESWRRASLPSYASLPGAADLPGFDHYAGASSAWKREIGQLRRSAGQGEVRFYYAGMAQAVLLDRVRPHWKSGALERAVEDLLADAVPRR